MQDLGSAKQKTVVLVSDGGDNCAPPAPCGVAREISRGGVALKIQAVGFRVNSSARRQLQCIAKAGGGRYLDATDAADLGAQLRALTARALRPYITVGQRIEAATQPEAAQAHPAGRYTTDLSPGQDAWYAFEVGAGQAIDVSTTLPASDAGIPTQLRTELQSERMEVKDSDLATNSGDVLTATMNTQAAPGDFETPPRGRVLVRLQADAAAGQAGPYPIEFTVRVTGQVAEEKPPPKAGGGGTSDDGGVPAGLAEAWRRSSPGRGCGARRPRPGGARREAAAPGGDRGGHRADRGAGPRADPDRGRRLVQRRAGARARELRGHAPRRRAALLWGQARAWPERDGDRDGRGRSTTSYFMDLKLYSSLRKEIGEGTEPFGQDDRRVELRAQSEPAEQPGIHFISIAAREGGKADAPSSSTPGSSSR